MLYYSLALCLLTIILELTFKSGDLVILIPYGIITPTLLSLPRLFKSWLKQRFGFSDRWLKAVETLGFFVVLINAPGSVFLHEAGIQYDRPLHFIAGGLSCVLIYLLFMPFFQKFTKRISLLILFLISLVGTFLWEGWQWTSDQIFGTQLYHDSVQNIRMDVTEDIIFGILGIIVAMTILNLRFDAIKSLVVRK